MGKILFSDLEFETPPNWQDQGMLTFTLPSPDKNVKPNIILTKERLPQPIPLRQYFDRIKQSIMNRGIRDFKPGQMVKQVQVTLLKDQTAVNLTGSFPADQFDIYFRPFQSFLKTIKFV